MKKKKPSFIRERRGCENDELFMCSTCIGVYKKEYKRDHQLICGRDNGHVMLPLISMTDMRITKENDDFKAVLNKMLLDDVSSIAKTDASILMIGSRLFLSKKNRKEKICIVEKEVRSTMRTLSRLYIAFKDSMTTEGCSSSTESSDMFNKENMRHLRGAIEIMCAAKEQNEYEKTGLKVKLQNVIKTATKKLEANYLICGDKEKANMIRDFMVVFVMVQDEIFGGAQYAIMQKRNKSTRRPDSLPKENDVKELNGYFKKSLSADSLCFQYPGLIFVSVRDALCARLTIYNGRRGGEPARLFLYQWHEALAGVWLRPETREKYKQEIYTASRITFQEGKGNKMVPVFIPSDCVPAMEFLSSVEVRESSGVDKQNIYMFPSTNHSDNHVSGWHCIMNSCKKANICDNVNGTMNRHRVSSIIGSMAIPENDKELIYEHFGHDGRINRDIYQVPQAERHLATTGKYLQMVDQGSACASTSTLTNTTTTDAVISTFTTQGEIMFNFFVLEVFQVNLIMTFEWNGYLILFSTSSLRSRKQ